MHETLRPNDADVLSAQLRELGRQTAFPVLFGGMVRESSLALSTFVGTRSQVLRGLVIESNRGAGGRAIAERRPVAVRGYAGAQSISHEYDRQVGAEGIETLLAVPVVVAGTTRAALYGGIRTDSELGSTAVTPVLRAATTIATELAIRDEVDRRVQLLRATPDADAPRPDRATAEAITESYLTLVGIARRSKDPLLEQEVQAVANRLRQGALGRPTVPKVVLSDREFEVLSHVALGCRNAEIATRLSLRPETVKSYLRNLMAKLDVHSRQGAVVEARRLRILP